MNEEQLRVYKSLRDLYIAELMDGSLMEAELAIVRLTRLQQITCGYAVAQVGDPAVPLGTTNPRLEALMEICESLNHPAIIWSRYKLDNEQIMRSMLKSKLSAVRYDGSIPGDVCEENKQLFLNGKTQFFVANTAKGGVGLTLTPARTVIYYSNYFSLILRVQSEDRAHRIGQEHPVNYIDLVAEGTVDIHIMRSLRAKFDVANMLNGDTLKEWLGNGANP
jgi:SNF2 family DNA or RNA helicase